jgi:hypothetical protein
MIQETGQMAEENFTDMYPLEKVVFDPSALSKSVNRS